MENYPFFRKVMLHFGVGYQCVTHPSAGDTDSHKSQHFTYTDKHKYNICVNLCVVSICVNLCPLDLHALDTPPALILSQDQTLKKSIFIQVLNPV